MSQLSHEDIDNISDIFRDIFSTDIIIVKAFDDGLKYKFVLPGFCIGSGFQDVVDIIFDTSNNTITHSGKIMEFNDDALEYLQSLIKKK